LVALRAPDEAAKPIWIWLPGAVVTKLLYASAYATSTYEVLPLTIDLMFGPTFGGVFDAAMLTTSVWIAPAMVVTGPDIADAIVAVVSIVVGAAAVALK